MANASNYLESGILEHIFRQNTFSKPTAWLALTSAVPTDSDTGASIDEIPHLNTAYVRQVVTGNSTWSVPAQDGNGSGYITNLAVISFPTYTGATSVWVSGFAILDGSGDAAGNMLFWGSLSQAKLLGTSDQLSIATGSAFIRTN